MKKKKKPEEEEEENKSDARKSDAHFIAADR